jgi:hypothetical protein
MTTRHALFVLALPMALFACSSSKTNGGASLDAALDGGLVFDLIADFTTDNSIAPIDGRQGLFHVWGDLSLAGQFDPPLDPNQPYVYPIDLTTGNPNGSGPGSFHTHATNWGVWGAALGTDFMPRMDLDAGVSPSGKAYKGTYDASKYQGISFWARATTALTRVEVIILDAYTDWEATFAGLPVPDGTDPTFTSCVLSNDVKFNCSPYLVKFRMDSTYFPKYQSDAYQIDTTWKRFDVFFADTRQDQYNKGFHSTTQPFTATNIDVSHLTSMSIEVTATYVGTTPSPNDFEIWVDDVEFIK